MKQIGLGLFLGCLGGGLGMLALTPVGNSRFTLVEPAKAATATATCSKEEEARNKAIVTSLRPRSPEFHALLAPDYVQHAPEYARFAAVNGLNDHDAVKLIEQGGFGKTATRLAAPAPGQPRNNPFYRVIAECDTVIVVIQHWEPIPEEPGKYYAAYFFNMWRLRDGKLVEHWDPDEMPLPLPEYLKTPVSKLAK